VKCITSSDCGEWLRAYDIEALTENGSPCVIGDYEIFFSAPTLSRRQQNLSRDLSAWIGEFETALLWFSDWPFYKPDEMAMISRLREAHGERRGLIDAPGHLFDFGECDELVGWVWLAMAFGWDGYLFTAPFYGSMFQTSHEDFVWVATSTLEQFGNAQRFVRKHDVEIYRETKVAL